MNVRASKADRMANEKNHKSGDEDVEKKTTGPTAPPGSFGARHLQVFLMFLGMMIAYGMRVILSVAIVAMTKPETANPDFKGYNWDAEEQSLVLSSFFWGYVITQIPCGYLANVWSAQRLLSMGLLICGLLSVAIPLVVDWGDWIAVCVCRMGMGLSQGCVLPGIQTLLARWVPPAERARLGTFAYAGGQLGTVITMPISGQLAGSSLGWPSIFYLFGAFGIGWAVLFFALGSDEPAVHKTISEVEKCYIQESLGKTTGNQEKEKLRTPWREIFTSLPMWALIVVHCGQNWGFWMLLTEMPTYMSKVVGFSIKENGFISALPYLAMWLLSFPASWLSDYALRRGAPRGVIRKTSNTIAHWGPALALIALCFVNTENKTLPVVMLIIAVGLNAGSLCGFQINHIDLSPNFAGTMMSITNCISSVVAIVAPIIVGYIVTGDQTDVNQWHTVFYISALIYFLGNLVFIIFGSGEVLWWNDPSSRNNRQATRSYQLTTVSATQNPSNMTLTQVKPIETT